MGQKTYSRRQKWQNGHCPLPSNRQTSKPHPNYTLHEGLVGGGVEADEENQMIVLIYNRLVRRS